MDSIEKRIEKLKKEQQKVEDSITKLKDKSGKISKKIEELENERIITAFKSSGFSLDEVITTISIMKSDDKQEQNSIPVSVKEEENHHEN